jgi:hypothetical protein
VALRETHYACQAGRLGHPAGHLLQVGPTPCPAFVCHDLGQTYNHPPLHVLHSSACDRLEFGLVFFIASCFYWVWDSMSSSAATDGERVSAYSVFNRGVSALPGSLPHHQRARACGCACAVVLSAVCRVRWQRHLQQGR